MEKHPIGSVVKGKVTSVMPFGAFVEIEHGIEGLVHVSEAAHSFVKNINEVVKVGDEVEVKVLAYDEPNKRVTLSIKACLEAPAPVEKPEKPQEEADTDSKAEKKAQRKPKAEKQAEDHSEWSENTSNNPLADLLKGLDIK